MDLGLYDANEIFNSHFYEDQNNKLWINHMDEILANLDWDDTDPEIMQGSKYATKSNYLEVSSKNLQSEIKPRNKLDDTRI